MANSPFYVYSWSSFDEVVPREYVKNGETRTTDDRNLIVVCYGVDQQGRTVCARLENVYRRIIIEFPDRVDLSDKNIARSVVSAIRDTLYKFSDRKLVSVKPFQPLYKPRAAKYMLELHLSSNIAVASLAKKLREGILNTTFSVLRRDEKLFLHEQPASAELQTMTMRHVPAVGWVYCGESAIEVPPRSPRRLSTCDREIVCQVRHLYPADMSTVVPDFTVVSWDCEAYINDISRPGDGPDDAIFQISIATNHGEKMLLTLGDPLVEEGEELDFELLKYPDERSLLMGFGSCLRRLQPNVITGWNVFGFDWMLLGKRAAHHMCLESALDFSLNRTKPPQIVKKEMVTAAAGHRTLAYPLAEGVVNIDMLQIIKDNMKLSKYSLESVGRLLLDEGKDDVDVNELFRCYRALKAVPAGELGRDEDRRLLMKVAKYCVQDSNLVIRIMEKQKSLLSLLEFAAVVKTPPQLVHTCGQQLRFYNITYDECRPRGIVVQSDHGGEYSGQAYSGAYVCDPKPGLYSMVVSFDFASMYPSIIQSYNIDFSTVVDGDAATPYDDADFERVEWYDHIGCEHDPLVTELAELKTRYADYVEVMGKNPVATQGCGKKRPAELGNSSPKKRVCRETSAGDVEDTAQQQVCSEELDNEAAIQQRGDDMDTTAISCEGNELAEKSIHDMTGEERVMAMFLLRQRLEVVSKRLAGRKVKNMCVERRFKIYQKERGVLPIIIERLLRARRETRAEMRSVTDPGHRMLLNQRQLAYKVAANSMYGAMGVDEGRLKCKNAAMCVTAIGRKSIIQAADFLKNEGRVEQVYGDTDSVYGRFPHLDGIKDKREQAQAVWNYANEMARRTTAIFRAPMAIEFEDKIYEKFLIISKKRYVYREISPEGVPSAKLGNRGVLLTRRDFNQFTKQCYGDMIRLIFDDGTLEDARLLLVERFIKLFTGQVPVEQLAISKSVNPFTGGDSPVRGAPRARGGTDDKRFTLYGYSIANPNPPEHLSAAEKRAFLVAQLPYQMQLAIRMRARGQSIPDGNRIEYCTVRRPRSYGTSTTARIEDIDYIKRHSDVVKVDYLSCMEGTYNSHTELARVVWQRQDPLKCVYDQFKNKAAVIDEIRSLIRPSMVMEESL
jgi:DNA polymerase elongation subunit (family B)